MRAIRVGKCHAAAGFTLVELMVAMITLVIVVGAMLAAYIYGIRMMQYVQPKLSASDEARRTLSLLTEDVRSSFSVKVGNMISNNFAEVAPFSRQSGSAIRIQPTTNANRYVIYFWGTNGTGGALQRMTNGAAAPSVIANCVSNSMVFQAEDSVGSVLTNNANNRVIAVSLQFYQLQHPQVAVGPGNYYDFYQLRTRITRRTLL